MKLIESSAQLLPQCIDEVSMLKAIENAGRICYKSEDKISDNSYTRFIDMLKEKGHYAMLEHGTVYLYLEINDNNCTSSFEYPICNFTSHYNWSDVVENITARYESNSYSKVKHRTSGTKNAPIYKYYITTNYRVIIENGWEDDLQFMCAPTEFHEMRYSMKLVTSIGITRELIRHRKFSFANESTRYCNYGKDKFDNGLTYIIPSWLNIPEGEVYWHDGICYRVGFDHNNPSYFGKSVKPLVFDNWKEIETYLSYLEHTENEYIALVTTYNKTPQQAREVLPLCTKSEIVMTGFKSDWDYFFDLRLYGKFGTPHPDMKILAEKIHNEFNNSNIL